MFKHSPTLDLAYPFRSWYNSWNIHCCPEIKLSQLNLIEPATAENAHTSIKLQYSKTFLNPPTTGPTLTGPFREVVD